MQIIYSNRCFCLRVIACTKIHVVWCLQPGAGSKGLTSHLCFLRMGAIVLTSYLHCLGVDAYNAKEPVFEKRKIHMQ